MHLREEAMVVAHVLVLSYAGCFFVQFSGLRKKGIRLSKSDLISRTSDH